MSPLGPLEQFRALEANQVHRWLKPGISLLDIGAGTGYQARIFHEQGCDVTAIDVAEGLVDRQFWPVQKFDGANLPFADRSFDVVFSSNVLEHVRRRDMLLSEIARVLRPNGRAIHIVPSATWRLWTSVARYCYALMAVMRRPTTTADAPDPPLCGHGPRHRRRICLAHPMQSLSHAFLGAPHGEYSSTLMELRRYRREAWLQVFRRSGFTLISASSNHLFYTGYTLLPSLSTRARRRFAQLLGSSCHVFVMSVER